MTLSITTLCHCAECRCAQCRDLFIAMPSDIMLSVIMLSVVMLNVVAPSRVVKIESKVSKKTKCRFLEQKVPLRCNFRCDQIYNTQWNYFGHTYHLECW